MTPLFQVPRGTAFGPSVGSLAPGRRLLYRALCWLPHGIPPQWPDAPPHRPRHGQYGYSIKCGKSLPRGIRVTRRAFLPDW